jgi:hypothetical protein
MENTLEWTESVPRNKAETKAFSRPIVTLTQQVIRFKLVLTPERFKRHQQAMQQVLGRSYAENLKITKPCVRDNRHTYGVTALILSSAVPLYERLTGFKLIQDEIETRDS